MFNLLNLRPSNQRPSDQRPSDLSSAKRLRAVSVVAASLVALAGVFGSGVSAAPKKKSVKEAKSVEEFLGLDAQGQRRLQQRIGEEIQKCMKSEGFKYFPSDAAAGMQLTADGELDQKAFAAKWGYGISTFVDPNDPTKSRLGADKNTEYAAKLSAADRKAYQQALVGSADGNASPQTILAGKSCLAKSTKSMFGDITKIFALSSKYQKEIDAKINTNPKVIEAMKKWSSCMKSAGFIYDKDSSAPDSIRQKFEKLVGASGLGGAASAGLSLSEPIDAKKIDKTALAKLQKDEIQTAMADFECTTKTLKLRLDMKQTLDREFLSKNEAEFTSLRDKIGG